MICICLFALWAVRPVRVRCIFRYNENRHYKNNTPYILLFTQWCKQLFRLYYISRAWDDLCLSPWLMRKTALVYDYAICKVWGRGLFLCDRSLLDYIKNKHKKNSNHNICKVQTQFCSHAWSLEKENLIQLGLGDATGGSALWMQTQNPCMAEMRDIKREKNSM